MFNGSTVADESTVRCWNISEHCPAVEALKAQVIKPNEALKLRARVDFEKGGAKRTVGEEWLVTF